MAGRTVSRLGQSAIPIVFLGLVLLGSTYLMSNATQDSASFGKLYSVLLAVNAVALISLGGLIAWNLYTLLHQARERRPGAKLTVRMVVVFVVLSVTPVTIVYYFSLQFLHRGIDSWFDVRIEEALNDALDLSRTALGVRMRELLAQTARIAADIESLDDEEAVGELYDSRRLSGAAELTLIGANGHIVGSSNADPTAVVPSQPSDSIISQARGAGDYIGLDDIGDSGLHVQVVVSVPSHDASAEPRLLQALFPVTERMNALAHSVESASAKYRELSYLRKPLKLSFTLTLSIVLLVSLFTAVYAAFRSARRMVAPLQDLSEGTKAVASGDYETQLTGATQDEIGFLVASFNEMTRQLKRAHDETRQSQQLVEAQRAYLETVLRRLSTGVLTLDGEHRLVTANRAAADILAVDLDAMIGRTLKSLADLHPRLDPFVRRLFERIEETTTDGLRESREQISVATPRGRRMLVFSAAALAGGEGDVIVFDDVTEFIQAQRNAAWSEVARRLAHEIKNPLTPIQLAAERLRDKYLHKGQSVDTAHMDRLTRTIVQQVESMKEMVNAFTDYARTPVMRPKSVDLNTLVLDVVVLYRTASPAVCFEASLDRRLALVHADPDRLRQLLHNLLKNAVEACGDGPTPWILTQTRGGSARDDAMVELSVCDSGPGFRDDQAERIFEPYVTSKPRGTGLGLAIAKKIVEEHGGTISGGNAPEGGARITVLLPAADLGADPAPQADTGARRTNF
ncbi:MAG: ATP-binding protein [Thiotrichales bacterium]|nr:ATP-binding protein [Thiotrichales bacterium]